ncbi:hypothetical protein D3C81_1006380 [compost metagenome]
MPCWPIPCRARRGSRRWWSTTATRSRWRRNPARWPKASRAKTCSPWCSSISTPIPPTTPISCCRPPRSSSTPTCTRPTATPIFSPTTPRSHRWARRCPIPRSSAGWRSAWVSPTRVSPTATRTSPRRRSCRAMRAPPASAGRHSRNRAGRSWHWRRHRSPKAAFPPPRASASSIPSRWRATASTRCLTTCRSTSPRRPRRNSRRATRWR